MIEAKNISKTYNPRTRKANTVLQDASVTFPDSGFVFIVGRSGTGKSTILNAMGGLISYQGEILFDNKTVDIDKYRAKNIGFVFQDFLLFDDLSVRENIKISLNIAGIYDEDEVSKRTEVLLKAVGLNINSKRKAYALSLGQRQRVAIARTLASNPHIILADEPTGNLDSKNSIIVMDILKKLSVDHLVICVTHNTNLIKLYADKAFAIVDKKFSEIDPATEKLGETYASSSRIEIGQMEEKEYQDENFLVKFYSSNGDSKQDEIKIVKKDGKILVIGENVSLASPSQLVEATASSDPGKKKEELKAIDLNFDNSAVKNKRTFKDSLVYSYFSSLFYSNRKLKKSTQFLKLVNTILPMILMVILSAVFVMLNTVKTYSSPTYANTDNVIGLINDDYLSDKTLTALNSIKPEEVYKLVYQEDTGLIETDSTNYSKVTENYGTNHSSPFTIDNFSLSDKLSSKNNIGNYSFSLRTSAIDNYRTIDSLNSSLKDFSDLKDDEIVIDETYLTNINYTFQNGRISFSNLP
ncbi:MAG: ATP-binding cassette domain-containing protein, partial [Bacilli bacterium]